MPSYPLYDMTKSVESFLLYLLDIITLTTYRRGRIKQLYFDHKKHTRDKFQDKRREFSKRFSVYYEKLTKLRLRVIRKYFENNLITRDQRLFNGRVLAAEAFKWDISKVNIPWNKEGKGG